MATPRETRPPKDGEGGNMGRKNGGDENPGAITGGAPISGKKPDGSVEKPSRETARANAMKAPTDNGDREAIPSAKLDKVYTADSKARWGDDQPTFADLQKERGKIQASIDKKAAKED